ncbi:MAG TPA: phospholipase D-like domain-containing protein [Propionibacteriaceae bacterium]|nr:phospholipase D-like domain-containing protein [Propionibacteriaceae bacterium]
MKRNIVRVAVAVLVIAVIAVSAAASFAALPLPWTGGADPASTTSPASTPPAANAPPAPAPVPAKPPVVGSAVARASFKQSFVYRDGVEVKVTSIKRSTLDRRPARTKLKKGAATQVLTVRITNRSRAAVRVAVASATMEYGPKSKVATQLYGKSITSLVGTVAPGRAKSGEYGFAVPKKYLNWATLQFTFDARHSPATFSGSLDYSPGNSTTFNDPTGTKNERFAISRKVERAIDAAPKGSTIRIAHYSFDITRSAERLLAAHRRGVRVQMIVDQHEDLVTKETRRLIRALGDSRKKKNFLIRCNASCMSNRTSAMHAKFYLFSAVGGSRYVSMISSANLTHTNSSTSWNDMQTVVGDRVIYNSLKLYFKDMAKDKTRRNYFRTTESGVRKLYLYPRSADKKPLLLNVLEDVSCSGAAPGYGTKKGKTIVRVGMYSWTSKRIDLARELWKLHNQGCRVEIIYNSGRTSSPISRVLLRRSDKHGQLRLHDAWRDRNVNNQPEQYMHEKVLTVNGVLAGRPNSKVVYAGSQNFTPNATTDNNDVIFRVADAGVYDAYADNFASIREKTPRLRYFVRGFQRDPLEW